MDSERGRPPVKDAAGSGDPRRARAIASKYGLDLGQVWNKSPILGHKGKHPEEYHQWVLDQMQAISNQLGDCGANCADKFLELFKEKVIDPVLKNPEMLKRHYWE